MGTSITLIGLSGSLRRESLNTCLLHAAQERMPQDCTLSIAPIPLYNFDIETEHGIPGPVTGLKDAIAAADGLLIATPEYNNSMPGVLKNAIDWLPVMRMLGARLWSGGRLVEPHASQLFDAAGTLTDEAMAKRLEGFVADFVADIRATRDYL